MDQLVKAIGEYRKCRATQNIELEIRLGNATVSGFTPSICKEAFDALHDDMKNTSLSSGRAWSEHIDYHYVTIDGFQMRTRVLFDAESMEMKQQHVIKKTMFNFLVSPPDENDNTAARVSIAEETDAVPPSVALPTHVRIKQRKVFDNVRNGNVVWSYQLSKSWAGNSRSEVESKQHLCEPTYEVECELVDSDRAYLDSLSDEEIAQSILLKAQMLIGDETSACTIVKSKLPKETSKPKRQKRSK